MDKQVLIKEFLTVLRFGLTGVGATLVHITVVWLLISQAAVAPMLANFLAFCCAFVVSFCGNYFWTFATAKDPWQALRRFFLIAVSGFLLNSALLLLIITKGWLKPELAAVVSAALVPVLSYLASRFWGFKEVE
jgi:putative flippase GtrA